MFIFGNVHASGTPVASSGMFVQGLAGPTWYQSDHNSNHQAFAQAVELGYKSDRPISIVASYLQSEMSDGGASQDVRNLPTYNHLNYDFEYKSLTLFVMPRFDFGNWTLAAGPGIGAQYSKLDLVMDDGRADSSNYWQDIYCLRADLLYAVTDHLSIGFTYRHDYFEVQLDDRDVSDYEVNQDRVYYMGNVRWSF